MSCKLFIVVTAAMHLLSPILFDGSPLECRPYSGSHKSAGFQYDEIDRTRMRLFRAQCEIAKKIVFLSVVNARRALFNSCETAAAARGFSKWIRSKVRMTASLASRLHRLRPNRRVVSRRAKNSLRPSFDNVGSNARKNSLAMSCSDLEVLLPGMGAGITWDAIDVQSGRQSQRES
jgi:hypothetical protein